MTMRTRALALLVFALLLAALLPATAAEPVKVVYHLNEGVEQAVRAMTNIRNHLSADPTAKIVVVAHGRGIDFLLKEAKTPGGGAFVTDIDELALRGVEFRVCRFTLERRNVEASRLVPDAKLVPSGVAEVARLQSREHYSYLKP
jgi:intracellular sulfur oxidation DsrE/DsrF family protein